ncbi:TIGR00730 family Rossman fold protein [Aureibacillus halotolerans]|uniref:Cytokinin riboside 5'-monophosphate phosphoribohydrolase n=1 Tax=Aureibacillus halotolerans TaxID=1508390 RepID=A0A4R6UD38_9BACI|nr:TIGR00730 family Rossman fold protein [Aureibacillus halotolerans]TDQ42685.1 hypothetical protein EV213_101114 [Aureibacillus halotolerans]
MKAIAVFCGSRLGAKDAYKQGAVALGKALARENITLVYGGASVGLMGTVADEVLQAGGKVIGVMPRFLDEREISHPSLTELIVVDSMHERKAKMAELSDGFIALPGGPGTLEEIFEVFTWAQLGLHQKPCGFLNIHQYYDQMEKLFDHMTKEAFLSDTYRSIALFEDQPETLIERFKQYTPPEVKTYITSEDQT